MAGYCGFSKSNNAIDAESRGLFTATNLSSQLGVTVAAVKAILTACEWHHSSKFFNKVDYYNTDEITEENISKMKDISRAEKKALKYSKKIYGRIEYLMWEGTRKYPISTKCSFTGIIEERGCFYYFYNMRKKINSNGTFFIELNNNPDK